jgi:hypothetical protein
MSGSIIALALMRQSEPLTEMVPIDSMIADVIPQGSTPPAIGAVLISQVYDRPLRRGAARSVTDRVQVTWIASSEPKRRALGPLVVSALDDKYLAALLGVTRIATRVDNRGPDFIDDAGRHGGSVDVMVSYNEAA